LNETYQLLAYADDDDDDEENDLLSGSMPTISKNTVPLLGNSKESGLKGMLRELQIRSYFVNRMQDIATQN
jgi:hypothetical protein